MLVLSCLCLTSYVFAIDNITLNLDSITGTGWQTTGVSIELHWINNNQFALTLNIATLTLPELKKPLKNLKLKCLHVKYNVNQITCPQANLSIGENLLDKPFSHLSFSYSFNSQHIHLSLKELAFAGGLLNLQVKSAPTGWQTQLNINTLNLEKLLTQLKKFIDLPEFIISGHTNLKVQLFGKTNLDSVSINGQATEFAVSSGDGLQAGENITVKIALKATRNFSSPSKKKNSQKPIKREMSQKSPPETGAFQVQGMLTINSGEIYIDPIFTEIEKEKPVTMAVNLLWQPQRHLKVHHFAYTHTDVATLQGVGEFSLGEKWNINTLSAELEPTPLKNIYTHYLQAWLEDDESQYSQLEIKGRLKATLDWGEKNRYVLVRLYNVDMEDEQKRFGLKGLHGKIQWHSLATNLPSHLFWSNAYFASSIQLGASQCRANLRSNRIELLAPWYQPIFDGAVRIKKFRLENMGEKNMSLQLSGKLYPISLSALNSVLGGVTLDGQLSGEIPSVSYHNDFFEISGKLRMHIFEGDIVTYGLSLKHPFGHKPVLKANNIEITRLNLQSLTKVTEFGEIQGQLSGYIRDLYLVNWEPVSFDTYFATPKDDPMPHKISQKAIKNISDLGGGRSYKCYFT
ncbi:hypothetical protein [Candidatus Parabeggiatoa sp. HSG14]|uniref:hypothetical protein n=1 Tax=Candidatus Parabeggiatoa sp. HSG14 TaxID=3055593 RepID=UPI0032E41023